MMVAGLGYIADNIILRNLLVVMLILAPIFFQNLGLGEITVQNSIKDLFINSMFVLLCIFHNRFLYSVYLIPKKYTAYVLFLITAVAVFQFSVLAYERYLLHMPFPRHSFITWVSIFWLNLFYMALGFGVYYSFNKYRDSHKVLNIKYLAQSIELQQLKDQLSPHFLFNALNNIYSYNIENDNKGNDLILKLSEMLRMILRNSAKEQITLSEEVDFITYYIDFEKERLGNRCNVLIVNHIDDNSLEIAPFILFTFIENAFKHGTDRIAKTQINLSIFSTNQTVSLSIKNEIIRNGNSTSSRTGLLNVTRRLELIYGDNFSLASHEIDGWYNVDLKIDVCSKNVLL